ncbi:MAG: BON domain-containing protein [Verrucomicrobiales bacterium]|nr:BON domain-containing protein [Verrucomicrobiales bacterium]
MKTIIGGCLLVSLLCSDFSELAPRAVAAGQVSLAGVHPGTNSPRSIRNVATPLHAADRKSAPTAPISAAPSSTNSPALTKQKASKPALGTARPNKKPTLPAANSRDLDIVSQLRDALSRDPTTRSWAIAVSVFNGVVFLSGTALSEDESTRATDLAMDINGVRQVNNGLRVPPVNRYGVRYPTQRSVSGSKSYTRTR